MIAGDPLDRLITDWLGGVISELDLRLLDERLRLDPGARARFRRAASVDSGLRDWAARREMSVVWSGAIALDLKSGPGPAAGFRSGVWRWALGAAAAVALSVATYHFGTLSAPTSPVPSTQILADGSSVDLNGSALIVAENGPRERRVRLERGEAHFVVKKDTTRPFIVSAAGVSVLAVGTSFNVRLAEAAVEVLVTEGQVRLRAPSPAVQASGASSSSQTADMPAREHVLGARQRAVVPSGLSATEIEIATLTPSEIERVLGWQHRLLSFSATPLGEVVAALNRRNATQLTLADPNLEQLRVSAAVRSDNVHGFVKLLETGFGVRAERRGEYEILLNRPP